jgi:hypothetical protein
MTRTAVLVAVGLLASAGRVRAQEAGGFVIVRGADTIAAEQWSREDVSLKGSLVRGVGAPASRERLQYQATLVDDGSAPLVELSVWRGDDAGDHAARQTVRLIFKDDSVAIDDMRAGAGVMTRVLPTTRAAIPYLNLSVAFLEQATRRAAQQHADTLSVPFFNLGGGQTLVGSLARLGADSTALRFAGVEFRLRTDAGGHILGGAVPAQGLLILRSDAH